MGSTIEELLEKYGGELSANKKGENNDMLNVECGILVDELENIIVDFLFSLYTHRHFGEPSSVDEAISSLFVAVQKFKHTCPDSFKRMCEKFGKKYERARRSV